MRVFGLTGGFASGKSTVVKRLRERGLPVIEADDLAREVVRPGSEGLAAVVETFGRGILDEHGALDRKKLGQRVFADPTERARLESVTHPRIRALQKERMAELAARGEPLACYEAPLLVEVGLEAELRPLVVVVADEAAAIERARSRDGLDAEAVRARLRAQLPLEKKRALADYVIDNSGSLDATRGATDEVLDAIVRSVGVSPDRYPRP